MIPLIILSLILGSWGIRQKSVIRHVKFDLLSIFLILIFFAGMIFGFSHLSSGYFFTLNCGGSILLALLSLFALIKRGQRLTNPVLNLRLFKNKYYAVHVFGFFAVQIMSLGNAFLIPNYIQLVNGNNALIAGLVVLPAGFAGAIMAPVGGSFLDKFGSRKPLLTGLSLMMLELAIFTVFTAHLNNLLLMLVYLLYMSGMGMIMGGIMADALKQLPKKEVTQGNAILNTVQQFAGATGTSITSTIVAFSQRAAGSKAALPTMIGTQHAYLFLFILCLMVWLLFFAFIGKKTGKTNS